MTGTTKTLYVQELFALAAGEVATRNYFAQFDEFEFQFITNSDAVEISAWGKNAAGDLVAAHRVLPAELNPIGPVGAAGATGATGAGLAAFGYVYTLDAVAQVVAGGADVIFSSNGPLVNETHTVATAPVTVLHAGNYQIDYSISTTLGVGSEIAIAVNGVVDPSTLITALAATGQVTGQAILTLAAGDVITLRNASAIPFTLTITPEVGAQLTINKLD